MAAFHHGFIVQQSKQNYDSEMFIMSLARDKEKKYTQFHDLLNIG